MQLGGKGGNAEDEMNRSCQLTSLLAPVINVRAPFSLGRLIASMKMRLVLQDRNVVCVIGQDCRIALRPFSGGGGGLMGDVE